MRQVLATGNPAAISFYERHGYAVNQGGAHVAKVFTKSLLPAAAQAASR